MVVITAAEGLLEVIIEFGIIFLEFVGVCVLLTSAIRGIIGIFKQSDHVRLTLAQGIALALEFKMGGEVLRTVIVRKWDEILILGAIIVLRAALTFLIHWEVKHEEERLAEEMIEGKL